MTDFKPGDRVVYKRDEHFPHGSTGYNGQTGTVRSIVSGRGYLVDDAVNIDWDEGTRFTGVQPYAKNLQLIDPEPTPTTEYEADSHFDPVPFAGSVVAHPSHYTEGRKYEPKDVIRDWDLNFNRGSAVKYISRAGRKADELEDLRKARQFLDFEIEALEAEAN